ncbi:MAG: trypsin-like peptidase domain-containing protein [Bacteroidales bacterium]|nr:trypsin-like peptidase domain-containing protein [Bacteroidales bacterium]
MNMKKFVGIIAIAFLGSILGIIGFSLFVKPEVKYVQQVQESSAHLTSLPDGGLETADFRLAAQLSVDAVVHVTSTKFLEQNHYGNMFEYFFNEPSSKEVIPKSGYGSGVIISPDGYIITNNHVIQGADEIKIKMNDGTMLDAELVGTDPNTDVAIVKVKAENLHYLTFGDSDELQLGDWVLAVGNPLSLNTTVTAGIVSAKARNIQLIGTKYKRNRYGQVTGIERDPNAIESFIQTDAAINPGNSGGALVNLRGELVGINTALASKTGAYSGYSFAIPSIIAKKVMMDIIEFGEVKRAALGVTINSVNPDFAKQEKLDVKSGVYVSDLNAKGGAAFAGLKKGDVILSINGHHVLSSSQLQEQVMKYSPGEIVQITVDRKGSEKIFSVELKDHDSSATMVSSSEFWIWLGADIVSLDDEDLERMDISHGVRVENLKDGVLKRNGVPEGFVITEINKIKINDIQDLRRIIESIKKGGVFIEGILTNGRYDYFTFRK